MSLFPPDRRILRRVFAHPILTGALGLLGGLVCTFLIMVSIVSGNWQMGVSHDWLLTVIYGVFAPAAVGIASPLWYWLGRPLWGRAGLPGHRYLRRLRAARFLPGIAAAVLGLLLLLPVEATSRFWAQTRLPFGLLVALLGPGWFWVGRPLVGDSLDRWIPSPTDAGNISTLTVRLVPAVAGLLAVSIAVTAVISLPVVAVGEPIETGSLTIAVTETRTAETITRSDGETIRNEYGWRLLLVQLTVRNDGRQPRSLPGGSFGDVAVIAPECRAQTFGEPSNNCNQVFLDGPFTVSGETYDSYEDAYATYGAEIAPDQTISGWYAYRIEGTPVRGGGAEPMVIVDDIGRWTFGYDASPSPRQERGTETPSVTPPG